MLYPLKFNPLFEERIWGGDQLRRKMDKKLPEGKLIGESWELSAVPGNVSVVANGKLAGNSLEELTRFRSRCIRTTNLHWNAITRTAKPKCGT